jgi:hypothetical protein
MKFLCVCVDSFTFHPFSSCLVLIGVGCRSLRFGHSNFRDFLHHLHLHLASNGLGHVDLEAGWGVGATNGERNDDAQANQDDGNRVDDDALLDHGGVLVFAKNGKREKSE